MIRDVFISPLSKMPSSDEDISELTQHVKYLQIWGNLYDKEKNHVSTKNWNMAKQKYALHIKYMYAYFNINHMLS